MAFEKVTCLIPVCDDCGSGCQDTEDLIPHFVTAESARKSLVENFGWVIGKSPAGDWRMLCPGCVTRVACDTNGCDWETVDFYDPATGTAPRPPTDMCTRCGGFRREDAPPPGHPDSMTNVLDRTDEELLAALDDELWPEEAV